MTEEKQQRDTTTVPVDFTLTAEMACSGDWHSRELNPVASLIRDRLIDDVICYVDVRPAEYFLAPRDDPRADDAWRSLPDDLASSVALLRSGELYEIRFTMWLPVWALAK
jgi:hypothetical protein